MSKGHTPGPWFVNTDTRPGMSWNRHIHSDMNTAICFMAHSDGQAEERDKANARLIAAAPELLEALKGVLSLIERDAPQLSGKTMGHARAVIANVEGGST